jgi:hypothetical protein
MKDHVAIVENLYGDKSPIATHWCSSAKEADDWLAAWMRENAETRPHCRFTIAKCVWTITD